MTGKMQARRGWEGVRERRVGWAMVMGVGCGAVGWVRVMVWVVGEAVRV